MLEICPRGQETSLFFQYLFLQRLLQELYIILAEDDHTDLRKTADTLWAIHAKQSHDVVAAVDTVPEPMENTVAAIPVSGNNRGSACSCGHGSGGGARGGGRPPSTNHQVQASTLRPLAQQSAGLCFSTIPSVRKRQSAAPPAHGRETSLPGCCQCRTPWFPLPDHQPINWHLLCSGH